MKRLILMLVIAIFTGRAVAGIDWTTDPESAQQRARKENKFVLFYFTEPDYCGNCVKMKTEVLDQPEFAAFAAVNLVPVELDFPHDNPLPPEKQKVNQQLAQILHVESFPQVVILDVTGHVAGHGTYGPGGARAYIADLEKIPGMKHVDLDSIAPQEPAAEAPRQPANFVPIAPAAEVRYTQLSLKAVSGPKNRRMALINNETLMAGESAKVKLLDARVLVVCKEIRDDSVLITADGKPMELKLGAH